jgi:hypothetical protein
MKIPGLFEVWHLKKSGNIQLIIDPQSKKSESLIFNCNVKRSLFPDLDLLYNYALFCSYFH